MQDPLDDLALSYEEYEVLRLVKKKLTWYYIEIMSQRQLKKVLDNLERRGYIYCVDEPWNMRKKIFLVDHELYSNVSL